MSRKNGETWGHPTVFSFSATSEGDARIRIQVRTRLDASPRDATVTNEENDVRSLQISLSPPRPPRPPKMRRISREPSTVNLLAARQL